VYNYRNHSNHREVAQYLKTQTGITLRTVVDLLTDRPPTLRFLLGTLPELDFSLVVPDYIVPCGPIIHAAPPLSDASPELARWLARGPTIYINLGSICRLQEDRAAELALALKIVLDKAKQQSNTAQSQVLWKLSKYGEYEALKPGSRIYETLHEEISANLVRIVEWIEAEPISILRS
jgi:hypothetical protein